MTPERFKKLKQALLHRQPDLTVLTDQVHKPQNIAAIMRTCDAFGIGKIHAVQPNTEMPLFHRTSGGSLLWMEHEIYPTSTAAISKLRSNGFKVVAAHFSSRAKDYRDIDYRVPTALVLGAEKPGISDETAELCDEEAIIPMVGLVESFNVSVASAIILNEAYYQRKKAGMYDQSRMDTTEFNATLVKWCYPEVCEFCDRHEIRYPHLDDDGLIIHDHEWREMADAIQNRSR